MDWESTSLPDAAAILTRRLQWYWRGLLLLPIAYLGVCIIVRTSYFHPNGAKGLIPSASEYQRQLALGIFVGLAVAAQAILLVLKSRYDMRIRAETHKAELLSLMQTRLLTLALVCDSVSALGMVCFLLYGDLRVMAGFGGCAYLLYAQIHPRERDAQGLQGTGSQNHSTPPDL